MEELTKLFLTPTELARTGLAPDLACACGHNMSEHYEGKWCQHDHFSGTTYCDCMSFRPKEDQS